LSAFYQDDFRLALRAKRDVVDRAQIPSQCFGDESRKIRPAYGKANGRRKGIYVG
jgi:hypothetical protein